MQYYTELIQLNIKLAIKYFHCLSKCSSYDNKYWQNSWYIAV